MRRLTRLRLISALLIAAGVTLLSWAGLSAGAFSGLNLRLVDGLFPAIEGDPRVVVVGIDDESLTELQSEYGAWPWDRTAHARLLDALSADGAALVGYDVEFTEEGEPEPDRALAEAVSAAGNVVATVHAIFEGRSAGILRASELAPPIAGVLDGAAAIAHVNVRPDPDGVVRSVPLLVETPGGDLLPSLSLALFQLSEEIDGPYTERPEGIQVGGELIPTDPGRDLEVNYAQGFRTYSAADVLKGRVPHGAFRDRIVLIGATAIGLGDHKITPLDKATGEPGVFVHANALGTMLLRAYLMPASAGANAMWVLALALVVSLAVSFLRVWLAPVVALGATGGFYLLVVFPAFDRGRVMNLVYPALALPVSYMAALGVRYFTEVRERRRVTRTFSRYLSGEVVEELLESPKEVVADLSGVGRPLSVLFADLRGFTAASEGAAPTEVVAALNVYLDAMSSAVVEEKGTIDKFMGDCVMAFWGAPRAQEDHAERAVRAAIEMLDHIDTAVRDRPEASLLKVKGCGVGVSTGEAVVGNIGSAIRLDYTAVGDTVNVASRLCGVAGPGQVVVTEECAAAIRGKGFDLHQLPPLSVKGKKEMLKVFQVLRPGQSPDEYAEGATLAADEDKGKFERAPAKAAGYAPVEPVAGPGPEPESHPRT